MGLISLHTERLELVRLLAGDFHALFEEGTQQEIMDFMGLRTEEEFESQRQKHLHGIETYRTTFVLFMMRLKENGETIGHFGFHNYYPAHRRTEMGYMIMKEEYRGQGYAREAMQRILQFGFESMNLNRVEAVVAPDNLPSIRLLERQGFKQEGLLRRHSWQEDRFVDSVLYGLLREDYFSVIAS